MATTITPPPEKAATGAKRVSNPEIVVLAQIAELMDTLPDAKAQARTLVWMTSTYGSLEFQSLMEAQREAES